MNDDSFSHEYVVQDKKKSKKRKHLASFFVVKCIFKIRNFLVVRDDVYQQQQQEI